MTEGTDPDFGLITSLGTQADEIIDENTEWVDLVEKLDVHEEGSPQPFITSLDASDKVVLDRRWTKQQIEQYSDRGAIENSYSSIKNAAAWTTSKEFGVRWFHFAFGCVIYNMWLLVDFLTQERIGVIKPRKKPWIMLSRFLDWLDKELITLM